MVLDKYSKDGKVVGQVELKDSVFNVKVNDELIYELVKAHNANLRQGNSSAKERSYVMGGGAKPFRQKGTGRARQGSIRSPHWKGGGVVFGPTPRCYGIDLPKKIKREAYRSLLSLKARQGSIRVVEDFTVESGKTKDMAVIGKALNLDKGVLLTDNEDRKLKQAIRNIPWVVYNNVKRMSGRDVFYSKTLLITESAVRYINEKYAKGE